MAPQWLTPDEAFVANLDPNGVEKYDRIAGVERPVLPFRDLFKHGVGDRRDEVGRHVDPVHLVEMAADLAHAHPARVHRNDVVVEIRKPPLIPRDQLRVERPRPITRNLDRHLRGSRQHGLLGGSIPPVRLAFAALLIEMLVDLGVQNALRQSLLQLIDKPVATENLLRVASRKKLVQNILLDRHSWVPFFPPLWPPAQDS
jgi:hypothetical protein